MSNPKLADRTLLVTVDSLRHDYYSKMPETQAALGESHSSTFSTSTATAFSFQSIIGGNYPGPPGINSGDSVVNTFKEASIPTLGYQSNPLLKSQYGYGDGFDQYDAPEKSHGLKDIIASHISVGSRPYQFLSAGYNLAQSMYSSTGHEANREYRQATELIDSAITDIETFGAPSENNWFVWIHLMEPHHPYNPSDEYTDISRTKAQTISRKVLAGTATKEEEATARKLYEGEVRETDAALSRLWDWTPDDTRIVFCADHGEFLGDRNNEWGHFDMFGPELLHVPFVTQNAPNLTGPVASLIDVPTVLTGQKYGSGQVHRELAFAANQGQTAVTDGRAITSDDGTYWLTDAHDESTPGRLERERSRFAARLDNRTVEDEIDMADLRDLGYA